MSGRLRQYLCSSIIKKQMMGVTGLLLCGFLVSHLIGNLLILYSASVFNHYAHALITNPLLYPAEAILALIFLSHIFMAIKLTIENHQARPDKYYVKSKTGAGATFASSTMPYTGFIILVFMIKHLLDFKFGPLFEVTYNEVVMRDIHQTVLLHFENPLNVCWYIFAMICLGIHVSHGFWSAFQSIGFDHPKYNCCIKCASKVFAIIVTIGYSTIPIWSYLQGGN